MEPSQTVNPLERRTRLNDIGCSGILLALGAAALVLLIICTPPRPVVEMEPGANPTRRSSTPRSSAKKTPQKSGPPTVPTRTWKDDKGGARRAMEGVKWKVVFEDSFDRRELGRFWEIDRGEWSLRQGRLYCADNTENGDQKVIICMGVEMKGPLYVTYEARILPEQKRPVDLSLMTNLPMRKKVAPNSGYIFQVGGWDNTVTGISTPRHYMGLARNRALKIIPGKRHKIEAYIRDQYLLMLVDGQVAAGGIVDPPIDPKKYPHYMWGGFYNFRGPCEFDNLVVRKPASVPDKRIVAPIDPEVKAALPPQPVPNKVPAEGEDIF